MDANRRASFSTNISPYSSSKIDSLKQGNDGGSVLACQENSDKTREIKGVYTNEQGELIADPDTERLHQELCFEQLKRFRISQSIFHSKLPFAFKVTDIKTASGLLSDQIKKGWRWISAGFIYNGGYRVISLNKMPEQINLGDFNSADIVLLNKVFDDPQQGKRREFFYKTSDDYTQGGYCPAAWNDQQLKAHFDKNLNKLLPPHPVYKGRQMPPLEEGDWVFMEGKTMRLLKVTSQDPSERFLCETLENKLVEFLPRKDDVAGLTDKLSRLSIRKPRTVLHYWDLPTSFLEGSYARLAGAYLRHVERLPKLQEAFTKSFKVDLISRPLRAGLYPASFPTSYTKYLSVQLKKEPLSAEDLLFIHQALGITLDEKKLLPHPTIENTLPFKKVLEMLTCFNPMKYADCPWIVWLEIFGEQRHFMLSKYDTADKQLMVSTYNEGEKLYVGNAYPWLVTTYGRDTLHAQAVNAILNNPISHSAKKIDLARLVLEFLVCTQVVEAHCTSSHLANSRVPGTGKQARAIFQYHEDTNTPLFRSFDINKDNKRMFPMAGNGGTEITRNAVNSLVRPADKATCSDMSDDSDVEEIG